MINFYGTSFAISLLLFGCSPSDSGAVSMKSLYLTAIFALVLPQFTFAAKVLKVKSDRIMVQLTRAEARELDEGDKVILYSETGEKVTGKLVRLKEDRRAVISSEDFLEYKPNDFVDVDYE